MQEKHLRALKALKQPKYWKPSLSEISRDTKIPISTLHDIYHQQKYRIMLGIKFKPSKEDVELAKLCEGFTGLVEE